MPGSATVTLLAAGYLDADLTDWYGLPTGHPYAGNAVLPILCYHVALPGRSVVVDAAAHEPTTPDSALPTLPKQLSMAGVDPESITDVVITHAHFDHFSALTRREARSFVPVFPNAWHYLGAADWRPETFGDLESRTLGVVCRRGLLHLVNGTLDLGDGLTLLHAPGETPGHQILYLETEELEAYFTGDLYHHPLEFAEASTVGWAEQDAMRASKKALVERAADGNALVYFSHIEGPYRVKRAGGKASWETA